MIRLRKTWSVILAVMLVITAFPAAVCAATTSGAASELRLARAEGTVGVVKSGGQKLSVKAGMRLYSGYKVTTQKKSYGYVSLDSAKAVKLDASSAGKVLQSGKKLELQLVSGKMMFNVSAPLKSGESMNIRTSTMVAGVRGTAGWVEINDRYTSSIHLLEGTLEVSGINPADGKIQTVTIHGGETVVGTLKQGTRGTTLQLMTGKFSEADVPGFVAVEVAADTALQQKITQLSDLSVPLIIKNAAQNLAAEEAAAQAADQALQAAIADTKADSVDPYYKQNNGSGGGGGGGAGGSGGSGTGETGNGGGQASETTLKAPSDASVINKALESNTVVNVAPADNAANGTQVDLNGLNVAAGKTLNIQSGVNATNDLTNDTAGTVTVAGTLNVEDGATLTNDGTMDVDGTLNAENGSSVTNNGAGTLNVPGTLNIDSGATVENNGTLDITSKNSVHVLGTLVNPGIINIGTTSGAGLLEVTSGGSIIGSGSINVSFVDASGNDISSMEVREGGSVTDQTITVCSYGSLINSGTLDSTVSTTAESSKFTNNGMVNGAVTISGGTATNTGTVNNTVSITGGSFTNSGTITSSQSGAGIVAVNGGTFNNTGGEVSNTSSGVAASVSSGSAIVSGGTVSSEGNTAVAVSGGSFEFDPGASVIKAKSSNVLTGTVSTTDNKKYTIVKDNDTEFYQTLNGSIDTGIGEADVTTLTGAAITQSDIENALANYRIVNLQCTSSVAITGTLEIPGGKTLNLDTGNLLNSETASEPGIIRVTSGAALNVTVDASSIQCAPKILIDAGGMLYNQGAVEFSTIENYGMLINEWKIELTGVIVGHSGYIDNGMSGIISDSTNYSSAPVNRTLVVVGDEYSLNNGSSVKLFNYGRIAGQVNANIGTVSNELSGTIKGIRVAYSLAKIDNYGLIGYIDLKAGHVTNESSGRIDTYGDGNTMCVYSDDEKSVFAAVYIDTTGGNAYFRNYGTVSFKAPIESYEETEYSSNAYAIYVKTSNGAGYDSSKPAVSIMKGTVESYGYIAICVDSGNNIGLLISDILSIDSNSIVRARSDNSSDGSPIFENELFVISYKYLENKQENYEKIGSEEKVSNWVYGWIEYVN